MAYRLPFLPASGCAADLTPKGADIGSYWGLSEQLSVGEFGRSGFWTVSEVEQAFALARRGVWALTTNYADRLVGAFKKF